MLQIIRNKSETERNTMDDSTTTSGTSTETISSSTTTTTTPSILTPPIAITKSSHPSIFIRSGGSSSIVLNTTDDGIEAEPRKLPSSKYKGVVPQPNGRWGAQIYEKHQRVWLGTFTEETDAAKAYDIAAQRFRCGNAVTNFKPLSGTVDDDRMEINFLNSHSKAEIVDMLRKHTYHEELRRSKKGFKLDGGYNNINIDDPGNGGWIHSSAEMARDQLFEKVVTPSDVGKLNRLVIPKQHAEKHFRIEGNTTTLKGVLLNFADAGGKVWSFRYSYWDSSQSYVFTKGWSRFVKDKGLKAGDIVSFQRSTGPEKQLYIDWTAKNHDTTNSNGSTSSVLVGSNDGFINPVVDTAHTAVPPTFRLFGVNISSRSCGGGEGGDVVVEKGISSGGKRMREMELFSLLESSCKKQQTVAGGAIG